MAFRCKFFVTFLLFPLFAALFALSCSGDSDMPCVTCPEPFPPNQQNTDGYCLYRTGCEYTSTYDCVNNGTIYSTEEACLQQYDAYGYCLNYNSCERMRFYECGGQFYSTEEACHQQYNAYGYCLKRYSNYNNGVNYNICERLQFHECEGQFYNEDNTCGGNPTTYGYCVAYDGNDYNCVYWEEYYCSMNSQNIYPDSTCGGYQPPEPPPNCPDASTTPVNAQGIGSVTCGNENYKTIKIGEQVWMAKNLNYNVDGSKCYEDDTDNCAKYGRLYNWKTAMGISSRYPPFHPAVKRRGICPKGWHIPTRDEWDALTAYVQSANGCSSCDAKHLKSSSLWSGGVGLDTYGFAALPGGFGNSDGDFYYAGSSGFWWSAESVDNFYNRAYRRGIYDDQEYAYWYHSDASNLFSVRCLKD